MKAQKLFLGTALLLAVFLIPYFVIVGCDRRKPTSSSGGAAAVSKIEVSGNPPQIYNPNPDTIASTEIIVFVTDVNNVGLEGIQVDLFTSLGNISKPAPTDASGLTKATLTSVVGQYGDATVIAAYRAIADTTTIPVTGPNILSLTVDPTVLVINGDSSSVTATLTDVEGTAIPDVDIIFSATLGSMSPNKVTTDSSGVAQTVYISGGSTGIDSLKATAGEVTSYELVNVVTSGTRFVSVSANPAEIESDYGFTTSTITANVRDLNNNAIPNVEVSFVSLNGIGVLAADTVTDAQGNAYASFSDNGDLGTAMIEARSLDGADTVSVSIVEVENHVILISDTEIIFNDGGITRAELRADLRNRFMQPIINDTVRFASTKGSVTGFGITDSSGIARATLISLEGETPGQAMVIAQYRTAGQPQFTADTAYVYVEEVRDIAGVSVTIFSDTLVADGSDSTLVSVEVSDSLGNPIGDSTLVLFAQVGNGRFAYNSMRTIQGIVQNYFRSYERVETDEIRITAGSITVIDTVYFVPGPPYAIDIPPDFGSIIAGSGDTFTVVATVADSTGNHVVDGTRVLFEHTKTQGNITRSSLTYGGQATALYTGGNEEGIDSIRALTDTTTVSAWGTVELVPSGSVQMSLSAQPNHITVRGVGGTEVSTILATLRDANQNPVEDFTEVFFGIESAPGGTSDSLRPYFGSEGIDTATSFTIGGVAYVSLTASRRPGTISIRAISGDLNIVRPIVTVSSGPPANVQIGLGSTSDFSGSWRWQVSAQVNDIYANPVVDSTAVFFWLEPDTLAIIDGNAYTYNESNGGIRAHGVAYSNIYYTCQSVFDTLDIYAQTDTIVGVYENAVLPYPGGEIIAFASPGALQLEGSGPNDCDTAHVQATLLDDNNCVIQNAIIIFSAEVAGNVLKVQDTTDVNGNAHTTFRICGDEIPDPPTGGTPTVTAIVRCQLAGYPNIEQDVEITCRRP